MIVEPLVKLEGFVVGLLENSGEVPFVTEAIVAMVGS